MESLSTARTSARRQHRPVAWEEVRCHNCRRLLFRMEPDALKPDKRLEVKCGKCELINYPIGSESI